MNWTIHHKEVTSSTNLDARSGKAGDVFIADEQTAGRGRLNHKWHSAPGENLMCSPVIDVAGKTPVEISTLPLVVGLAVLRTIQHYTDSDVQLKWPNDIFVGGHKISGILCERNNDNVIAGIGINVNQKVFPPEISARATSLTLINPSLSISVRDVLKTLLNEFDSVHCIWREKGFSSLHPQFAAVDYLKGKTVSVLQTDDDSRPLTGICAGIQPDGTLSISGTPVYAGEAHILL